MKNNTDVISADLTASDTKQRKRLLLALLLVLCGTGLVVVSLCLDRSGVTSMGLRGLGCALIGAGFLRAMLKPRVVPEATK